MLKINEIFLSIQGESTYSGRPCIFIRLSGCNLKCSYCDTQYHAIVNFELSIKDIIKYLNDHFPKVGIVEITGGEPLIQPEAFHLLRELLSRKYEVLLETNGAISLKEVPAEVVKIVDVKLPGSGEDGSFLTANLKFLDARRDQLKFVISDRKDYSYTVRFLTDNNLSGGNILLSTVFKRLSPETLAKWILEDNLNVRLQLQLHKYIWDPQKTGV
ncbi:MAG: radical SAM protein [Candidatus Cloacimonetes bacterium]|nr:radical SAM protein [Candidatus Cloacimonadota bacterium]